MLNEINSTVIYQTNPIVQNAVLHSEAVDGHNNINNKQSFFMFNYCTMWWIQILYGIFQEDLEFG